MKTIVCIAACLLMTGSMLAQDNKLETDAGMHEAVASQDAETRAAMLTASQYPKVLSLIEEAKDRSQASFRSLVGNFEQKKQGWFYELSRYPDLMHTLATKPAGASRTEINPLLPNQDKTLQNAAWHLYNYHHADLTEADNMNQQAKDQFEQLIQKLEAPAQSAFRTLSTHPDVMSMLTENIPLTTRLGEQYSANPTTVTQQLATKHDSLVVQNQQEIANYKQQLDANPDAQQQLNQAAQEYANTNGYILPNQTVINMNIYANPYSYWFGYPYWYDAPLWYPGAYWNCFGMTYGLGWPGFYAFPSYGFTTWFFRDGYWNYPALYRVYGSYYRHALPGYHGYYAPNHAFMQAAHEHFAPGYAPRMVNAPAPAMRNESMPEQHYAAPQRMQPQRSSYGNFNTGGAVHINGGYNGGFRGGFGAPAGRHR
jgi:hypothetical protein